MLAGQRQAEVRSVATTDLEAFLQMVCVEDR